MDTGVTCEIAPPVTKFIVPDWGIQLTREYGCLVAPACQPISSVAGRYDNPMPELTLSSQSEIMNLSTGFLVLGKQTFL